MVVVGVLGPVLLRGDDGTPVPLASSRQRRLLAALALHPRVDVDRDVLADLVWDDARPADPCGALQTNVARLRRVLPPSVSIATGARSYRLVVADDAVDATGFTAHLLRAAAATDAARRLDELDAALSLWRGRPFGELDHPAVEPEVARLAGLRATALEDRVAALLDLGRAGEAVPAAAALVAAEPLRESAVALLMRAQVAAGRPGEALQAFARLRADLAEELGGDPSPQLARLHEQVLRHEAAPARGSAVAGRTPRSRPTLPISSFVGRDTEVAEVAAVLAARRVVTLCGPGGVGKSRLARHIAEEVADRYDDGVVLVELAATATEAVASTVAAALRLTDAGPVSLTARIVEVLSARRQLLVLDDCEHVADAVAALVEAVAAGAASVDVLATSREALRVDGEQVLSVVPLAAGPAAALLADRIRAADPAMAPSGAADAALVEQICTRLDRLPLALELAAARVPAVGLRGLLGVLDDPLDALGRGRRTAAPRHRSLRDVVEWSYGLLDDEQRALFVRLGVFAAAVEPAAVAAVCGFAHVLPDLVDRSLVVRVGGEPVSYGMLDTLRAFGRARLASGPESATLRARHAAWAVDLVVDTGAARSRADEPAAIRRFDTHLPDIGRAHAWLCRNGPLEDLLRLGLVCAELGYQRARVDLAHLVDEALRAAGCEPDGADGDPAVALHPLLPRLLGLSAAPMWQRGEVGRAELRCRRASALADRLGDPLLARDAQEVLCNVALFGGELTRALEHGERAVELARAAGDDTIHLMALVDLTITAAYAGNRAAAAGYEAAAVRLAEQMGSPLARGWAAYAAGERRAEAGDAGAAAFLEEAVALAGQVDAVFLAGVARHTLLTTAARSGDPERALWRYGPLLETWHGMGAWTQLWIAVRALTEALSRRGRHGDAAVLLGAMRASPRASVEYGADRERATAVQEAALAALGNAEFEVLRERGAALGDAGAVAFARRLTRVGDPPRVV